MPSRILMVGVALALTLFVLGSRPEAAERVSLQSSSSSTSASSGGAVKQSFNETWDQKNPSAPKWLPAQIGTRLVKAGGTTINGFWNWVSEFDTVTLGLACGHPGESGIRLPDGRPAPWAQESLRQFATLPCNCYSPAQVKDLEYSNYGAYNPSQARAQSSIKEFLVAEKMLVNVWNDGGTCYAKYQKRVWEVRSNQEAPVYEQTQGIRLEVPLGQRVDPKKTSVVFTSDHLVYKYTDSSGKTRRGYHHPVLSEVKENALVFEIPVDPSKGEVTYPKEIEYRLREFR